MNPERWQQIDSLFHETLAHAPAERSAFLLGAAGNDDELIREVQSLLDAQGRAKTFLDDPAHGGVSQLLDMNTAGDITDAVGLRIGPYRITRPLAAGGMGAVYLAVRDDAAFEREVAIKLIRRGMLGSSSVNRDELMRRFQLERQVLADLDHPYIARLIDGGTTPDNRPYVVMEYVEGEPIDAYCDQRNWSIRQRLELFAKVCEAVQHAHQNLIIHRDIKPGNILVTAEGEPKLLDFGLAKLIDPHRPSAASQATMTGEFMGTFAYAAPEQVTRTHGVPDMRTDVYALGMILYRLLTGQAAYDLTGDLSEALKRIADTPPDAPSRRSPRVGDELDTIILKALSKDQNRRYQSAGDLRADVDRYLRGEAIVAKADSGWYVLRKTARRYRLPLTIAAGVMILLTAFTIISTYQANQLSQQKGRLATALHESNIERGRALMLAGNTARAEEIIWKEHLAAIDDPDTLPPGDIAHGDRLSYWALWELYAREPCIQTLQLHAATGGSCMAMLDNSRAVIHTQQPHGAFVVDLNTAAIKRLTSNYGGYDSIAVHPDGRWLAVAYRKRLELFDTVNWSQPAAFPLPDETAPCVAFDATGESLFASVGGTLHRFRIDPETAELIGPESQYIIDDSRIRALVSRPGDHLVAATTNTGSLHLIHSETGHVVTTMLPDSRHRGGNAMSFDHTGRFLACDTGGADIIVLDLPSSEHIDPQNLKETLRLTEPNGWVRGLAFHPTRRDPWLLAAGSADKVVRVWEVPSGRLVHTFHGLDAAINSVAFTPDGSLLGAVGSGDFIKVWETAQAPAATQWAVGTQMFQTMFTRDDRWIVCGVAEPIPSLSVLDGHTGELVFSDTSHGDIVSTVALHPTADRIITGSYDGRLRLWSIDPASGQCDQLRDLPLVSSSENAAQINSVTFSPDGKHFASCSDDQTIRVWNTEARTLDRTIQLSCYRVPSIRYSPDGRWLVCAVVAPHRYVYFDTTTWQEHTLLNAQQMPRIVRFAPNGLFATGGDDLIIRVWRIDDRGNATAVGELPGHQRDIFAIAFSPDSTMLASSGRGGDIKLWDVLKMQSLATLAAHTDMVFSLDFSSDGRTLISGGRDGVLRRLDMTHFDRHIRGNEAYWRSRLVDATK